MQQEVVCMLLNYLHTLKRLKRLPKIPAFTATSDQLHTLHSYLHTFCCPLQSTPNLVAPEAEGGLLPAATFVKLHIL
eukprot:1159215-Pelagomonas_calceolata.AAC.8